jgi:steroid delta-isomerase-like uncharacterized protein
MTNHDGAAIVRAHYDAYNRNDLGAGAELVAPHLAWTVVPFQTQFEGPDGYQQFFAGWIAAAPDGQIEDVRVLGIGDVAVGEYLFRGRQTGTIRAMGSDIAPTGQLMEMPVCEVFEFEGGKIARVRTYFDVATLMRQLGLME